MKRKCGCNRCISNTPDPRILHFLDDDFPGNPRYITLEDGTRIERRTTTGNPQPNGPRNEEIHTFPNLLDFEDDHPEPTEGIWYLWRIPEAPFYEWRRFNG